MLAQQVLLPSELFPQLLDHDHDGKKNIHLHILVIATIVLRKAV